MNCPRCNAECDSTGVSVLNVGDVELALHQCPRCVVPGCLGVDAAFTFAVDADGGIVDCTARPATDSE